MCSRFSVGLGFLILVGSVAHAQTANAPMTAGDRLRWIVHQNISPVDLLEDVAAGAETTLTNKPKEYGPHWVGFGKRVGIVAANYGVKTVMEAGLGSIWGEDRAIAARKGNLLARGWGTW